VRFADESDLHRPGAKQFKLPEYTRDHQRGRNNGRRSNTPRILVSWRKRHFAEICESCQINFIGPTPENMRMMGDKMSARNTMQKAGVRSRA